MVLKFIFELNNNSKIRFVSFIAIETLLVSISGNLDVYGKIFEIEKIFLIIFIGILLSVFILKSDIIDSIIAVTIIEVMYETLLYILMGIGSESSNVFLLKLGETSKAVVFCLGFLLDWTLIIVFYKLSSFVMKKFVVKNNINCIKLVYAIITLIIALTNLEYYKSVRKLNESKLFIVNLMIMILYCIFSLAIVNVFNEYEKEKEELTYQIFYNKTLEYLMEDLRRFKHDYNNMLAVFGGYLQLEKYDDLKKYYKEIAVNLGNNEFSDKKSILEVKNAGVLGLLFYKLNLAKEKNIKLVFNIKANVNQIDMKINEFCEMLGILLDNAIEAADNTIERLVNFSVYMNGDCQIFEITNSIREKIDTRNIYKKGYTSKGKQRGMGLYVVEKIIKNNTNLKIQTECLDNNFVQKVYIKIKKDSKKI